MKNPKLKEGVILNIPNRGMMNITRENLSEELAGKLLEWGYGEYFEGYEKTEPVKSENKEVRKPGPKAKLK